MASNVEPEDFDISEKERIQKNDTGAGSQWIVALLSLPSSSCI